ncbi:hypothetical protein, partial [Escherichia coli]
MTSLLQAQAAFCKASHSGIDAALNLRFS